jgi:hypothetical protein
MRSTNNMKKPDASRREFVKKAGYIAPAIVTLAVTPSYAKAGSLKPVPRPRPRPIVDTAVDATAITE